VVKYRFMPPRIDPTSARWFWWTIWAALGLIALAIVAPSYLNHDDAWYLYMGRVVLDGGTIYRDVVDTNPPLIIYLMLPAVWLAGRLDLNAVVVFKAFVFAMSVGSLLVAARLLPSVPGVTPAARRLMLTALVFALLPMARVIEFGQREHFMAMLTMPYVFAAIARAGGQLLRGRVAWPIGMAAGLGFAIKPHALLAWLAIELALALLWRARVSWRRPEVLGSVASMVAYGVAVVLFVPQYLPLADRVRQVYGGMNATPGFLFQIVDIRFWFVGLASMALVRLPRDARPAPWVLFAAWTGFLLAALIQLKGWNYHLYPSRVACLLFFVTAGAAILQAVPALGAMVRGGLSGFGAAVIVALFAWGGRYIVESRIPADADLARQLIALTRAEAPAGPIAALGMRAVIYPAFPAVNYSGAQWSLRHNSLWFLPGLYESALREPGPEVRFRHPDEMSPLERGFYDEVVSDLCARPPSLLLIESASPRAPLGRRGLDLGAYYGQDARFRRLFSAYDRVSAIGPFAVFKRVRQSTCRQQTEAGPASDGVLEWPSQAGLK
jgi:hypothetical protein